MKLLRPGTALGIALVASLNGAFGLFGLKLAPASGFATLVWPPSGISLAAWLMLGPGIWPGIAISAFFVNVWSGAPILTAVAIALGNTMEAALGAWALRRFAAFEPALQRTRDIMALAVVAAVLSTAVGATVGVTSLLVSGIVQPSHFDVTWRAWQLGDSTGDLVMAPLILSWWTFRRWRVPSLRRLLEAIALAAAVVLVSLYVFGLWPSAGGGHFRLTYWLAPLFVWASLRFGQPATTATTFAVSAVAIWSVMLGASPLQATSAHENLVSLTSLITVAALTNLLLAASVAERTLARKALREVNEALEQRVEHRTRQLHDREEQIETSLRQKELLLREMHHRVKNNLQIISSLVRLQRRDAGDARTRAVLRDCENRVRSIAVVHEELYRSADLATIDCQEYFKKLVANLVGAYEVEPHPVSIDVDARGCALSIDSAIPCGLIVNELVSNALKHAFIGRTGGRLTVALHRDPGENGILLEVCDDGIGFPPRLDHRATQTLGLKLVSSLVAQMHGVMTMESEVGTRFRIRFPSERLKPRAAA